MGAHILAGIAGRKVDLRFAPNGCIASVPGHGPIANLELTTVDALLTPSGMLVHKDSKSEVRMMQIQDGKTIYHKSAMSASAPNSCQTKIDMGKLTITDEKIRDAVAMAPTPGTIKMSAGTITSAGSGIPATSIKADQLHIKPGAAMEQAVLMKTNDGFRMEALNDWIKHQVEQMVREQVKLHIAMIKEDLEKRLAALPATKTQPSPARIERDAGERSWGSEGGLPNFLTAVDDNPFARRR